MVNLHTQRFVFFSHTNYSGASEDASVYGLLTAAAADQLPLTAASASDADVIVLKSNERGLIIFVQFLSFC